MEARLLDDREEWNSWVIGAPAGNILQSFEWGELKAAFGWRAFRIGLYDGDQLRGGAQVLLRRTPVGAIAYCPRGPLADYSDERTIQDLLQTIHDLARREGASFLKIEPPVAHSPSIERCLSGLGFHRSGEIQPRSTIIIDLTPSVEILLANMHIKTRYNVGLASRRNVKIIQGSDADLPTFQRLLEQTARRGNFAIHSKDYYEAIWRVLRPRGMAQLLLASYEGEVVAATMIFVIGPRAYYMYGASSGRHRNVKPSDLLQWESIKWAKSIGCTCYDMWGIPDEVGSQAANGDYAGTFERDVTGCEEKSPKAISPLWGVYQFKRGFGGKVVRYAGAFDYVYSPIYYWLWTKAIPFQRQIFGKLRKYQYVKAS